MWIFWVLSLGLQVWLTYGIIRGSLGILGILGELVVGTLTLLFMIPAVKFRGIVGDIFGWIAILILVSPEILGICVVGYLILH